MESRMAHNLVPRLLVTVFLDCTWIYIWKRCK